MEPVFNVVLPVFALILCGYLAGATRVLGSASSEALNRFVYWFALPVLLFRSLSRVSPEEILNWPYLGAFLGGSLVALVLAMLVGRLVFRCRLAENALFGMNAIFGNTGYMGIPLCLVAFGDAGVLPAIVATVFQTTIFMALVTAIAELDPQRTGGRATRGAAFAAIAKNPLILASIAGAAWSATGLSLPVAFATFADILGAAAGPCALFAIGLFMVDKPLRKGLSEVMAMTGIKLIVHPLVTWALVAYVFDIEPLWAAVAVLMAALPTGALCFVLAQNYGLYVQRTSAMILISTVLAVVTLSILFTSPLMAVG